MLRRHHETAVADVVSAPTLGLVGLDVIGTHDFIRCIHLNKHVSMDLVCVLAYQLSLAGCCNDREFACPATNEGKCRS
jgi:hypothetical protein